MTARPDARLRLFVALALPATARAALWEWSAALDPAAWRRVPEANLHVTLAFLGPRPAGDVAVVEEVLGALPPAGVALRCSRVLTLPPRRPRVVAVELASDGGALGPLQAAVAGGLERAGVLTAERRPFLAHVTVGRARRGAQVSGSPVPAVPSCAFPACAVVLYASRPGPGGSRYEALVSVPLGASDGRAQHPSRLRSIHPAP